jgi:hypothetical protein
MARHDGANRVAADGLTDRLGGRPVLQLHAPT